MLILRSLAYLILVATTFFLGCESLSYEETESEYPVIIKKLQLSDLETRNEQYHDKNDGLICSTLNEYALTGFSRILFPNDINPCLNREETKVELEFGNGLLEQVKDKLYSNSEFSGVIDPSQLIVKEIISLDGCTICEGPDINNVPLQWKFTFEPQFVNGVEVQETELVVYVDINGVNRIWGSWYNIVDPGFIEFGSSTVKDEVIGLRLRYANERNQVFEQEILEKHVIDNVELKYSPIETEEGLEIHKAWIVSVLLEGTEEIKWQIRFSTITGEMLDKKVF